MSTIYKLFIELIKLFIPKLNLGSVMASVITKLLFALILGGVAVTSVVMVKNKYNQWKEQEARIAKAENDTKTVIGVNAGLVGDLKTVEESGKSTVETIIDNAKASSEIKDKSDTILADLDRTRKDIEAGKTVTKKVVKTPPKKPLIGETPEPVVTEVPVTQTDANINAMWNSYCSMGGDAGKCAANS